MRMDLILEVEEEEEEGEGVVSIRRVMVFWVVWVRFRFRDWVGLMYLGRVEVEGVSRGSVVVKREGKKGKGDILDESIRGIFFREKGEFIKEGGASVGVD